MPLIEFRCTKCHAEFEELIYTSNSIEKVVCPHCSAAACERLISTFGFRSSGTFSNSAGASCSDCSRTSCNGCSSSKGDL
ncbi:zinc ribbon domain-containing protein [candidate division WOR-3 bacterium]|nr:zinc ribbon domain-containing protein [candidate division WOR-3 bacterium]